MEEEGVGPGGKNGGGEVCIPFGAGVGVRPRDGEGDYLFREKKFGVK